MLCCAPLYSVALPCIYSFPYSPYLPHPQACTWFNLLLRICIGIGAGSCVASAGRSISVTILQIRIVLSRQGSVCLLSFDLTKLVLNFQPAFSDLARACEFRHTVKWCLVLSREAVFQGEWFSCGFFPLYIQCSGLQCEWHNRPDMLWCSWKLNSILWLLSYPLQHPGAWLDQSCS